MAAISLYSHQLSALRKMHNGCILNGGVGSGKSRTALAYYYILNGGKLDEEEYYPMEDPPADLYIITTARKRDTFDWELEMAPFLLSTHKDSNLYSNKVIVDSWNNIAKYKDIENSFFIFDEQRVVGYGAWVKAFLKITKLNQWILLSATPGDCWTDYIPVFIANGFYRNKSEFCAEHVIYSRFSKYPKVDRYINTGRLIRLRNKILVDMEFDRHTVQHHTDILVNYDISKYKEVGRDRWDTFNNCPIENASELCYVWRKIVNTDSSRINAVENIMHERKRIIIFYNFNYELDMLREMCDRNGFIYSEWNGCKHQEIPDSNEWVYLVQYTAGCEGWNCIKTDTIVFYSQNYSYKVMAQAYGRIDRLNTPFIDLYYFHIKSKSPIDLAISKALKTKKNFNESRYVNGRQ